MEIKDYPTSINTEPFNINVLVTGASTGTNYLRIDLYKEGSENYFEETYNGSSWYGGSDGTQYCPVTISSEKIGQATIQARIGNPSSK